jgi:hypothetical protein
VTVNASNALCLSLVQFFDFTIALETPDHVDQVNAAIAAKIPDDRVFFELNANIEILPEKRLEYFMELLGYV